jgi:predicted dienelactone hydrolase
MPLLKTLAKATAAAVLFGLSGWGAYEVLRPAYVGSAGITHGSAYAPVRGTDVEFDIWYPAKDGGKRITVGGNGVFFGTDAGRGAPFQDGRFPVVIISHGAGGNAGQFGWIASELAHAGFVVVLPNHPGTTTGNASAEAAVRVWERPADVSAVLDELTENTSDYPYMDTAGGYTAMAVAGARVDPDRLQRFCDTGDHGMSDCAFLAHFGIDLHDLDLSLAAQDLRDRRIKTAGVVDPGIVSTLTKGSLSAIDIPMLILNLGDEETIPSGVYARGASDLISTATYEIVPDAIHFSFLAQCKSRGAEILEKEGELDRLCDDAGGRSRSDIHRDLSQIIVAYFRDQI